MQVTGKCLLPTFEFLSCIEIERIKQKLVKKDVAKKLDVFIPYEHQINLLQ